MLFIVFIFGLVIGSFLNAYIFRLRQDRSVWRGRSRCPKCEKILQWHELIPVVSFIIQRGRCRACRQKIDWQYPLVELATGILFVLTFNCTKLSFVQVAVQSLAFVLIAVLIIIFIYDLRYGLVPDRVVLPAIVIAILYTVILNVVKDPVLLHTGFFASLRMTAIGVVVGAGFFWLQFWVSRGRWLGAGDIRIGALMGAMLGWPLIIEGIVVSYIMGGAIALCLLAAGKKKFGQTLPLGTFLTLGTAIVFLYGTQIWNWYW